MTILPFPVQRETFYMTYCLREKNASPAPDLTGNGLKVLERGRGGVKKACGKEEKMKRFYKRAQKVQVV